jgi:hypothetical protein
MCGIHVHNGFVLMPESERDNWGFFFVVFWSEWDIIILLPSLHKTLEII